MLENFVTDKFEYKKLSESEQKARRILGRLTGVIAETKKPTRNGRGYSIELWENVFANPIMKEKIANRCCFGELNHPADRTEIDIEKVAICLAEQPKKSKDGRLYGIFDILDTPNGRILKTLCDYGCKIGISSRGQGDIITDRNGEDMVDPDTYECECFDAVLIPGVEAARLTYVTESLDTKKSLRQTLNESLDAASEDEKLIMKETLENLNLILEDTDDDIIDDVEVDEVEDEEVEEISAETTDVQDPEAEVLDTDIEEVAVDAEDIDDIDDDVELELSDTEEVEDAEEEATDEEIFLDFLANNFDVEKVKEVCKILDIELEIEDEAEAEESEEAEEVIEDEDAEVVDVDSTEEVEATSDENINSDEDVEEQDEEPVQTTIFRDDEIEKIEVVKKPKTRKNPFKVIWTKIVEEAEGLYDNVNQEINE